MTDDDSRRHAPSRRSALAWTLAWVAVAIAFGAGVWAWRGRDAGVEFYTAYLLEKMLSVDNLFVFLIIFSRFGVPPEDRRRVLTWGILGAIAMRAVFIFAGIELMHATHAAAYAFGALLAWVGIKTLLHRDEVGDPERSWLVRAARRVVPMVPRYDGGRFVTRERGRRVGTLLLLVLIVVEASDAMFAIDSIPAVFAITDDPFLVLTSNLLALFGLRSLFFVVGDLLGRLRYLKHGLGVLLVIVGAKMLLGPLWHVPPIWSLAITCTVLLVTVVLSLARRGSSA
jgi:TerC family integral membrane protein